MDSRSTLWHHVEADYYSRLPRVLNIDKWTLDGQNLPVVQSRRIELSGNTPALASGGILDFEFFPLVPSERCLMPARDFAIYQDGSLIRVGSNFFGSIGSEPPDSVTAVLEQSEFVNYWQDICTHGPFVIACRRWLPRETSIYSDDSNGSEEDMETEPDSEPDTEVYSEAGYQSQDSIEDEANLFHDYSNSCSEYTDGHSDVGMDIEIDDNGIAFGAESDVDMDTISSGDPLRFDFEAEVGDESDDGDFLSTAGIVEDNSDPQYPVEIGNKPLTVICDRCKEETWRHWYHCRVCRERKFNVCFGCRSYGHWCDDENHQLFRMRDHKVIGVITPRAFETRRELSVYSEKDRIFHWSDKHEPLLHESPPAIHPKHPLVVWPASGSEILFVDLERKKSFKQDLQVSSKNSKCVVI